MTGFFDTDRWNEIWQTISRNRRRSIMTALGVFWGIFMLIVLLGAGTGLGRMFRAQLGGTATNAIFIMSDRTSVPYEGMNPKARLLGTAFTVNAPAGDNLLFHKALDMAQPGDVIVLANKGSRMELSLSTTAVVSLLLSRIWQML